MACNPTEAYFVIKDIENPDKEMKDYYKFSNLRRKWENKKISVPQQDGLHYQNVINKSFILFLNLYKIRII